MKQIQVHDDFAMLNRMVFPPGGCIPQEITQSAQPSYIRGASQPLHGDLHFTQWLEIQLPISVWCDRKVPWPRFSNPELVKSCTMEAARVWVTTGRMQIADG